ncbi:unnamed protein product [Trichogramma brassicae]|uniref:Uncharacterized protein n=1 Tax=Trichogramma brassicae TaxID=86971 RepID=A0A6H5IU64_9HYME|nr:unnamed protein product [Trichogramma brassicae]
MENYLSSTNWESVSSLKQNTAGENKKSLSNHEVFDTLIKELNELRDKEHQCLRPLPRVIQSNTQIARKLCDSLQNEIWNQTSAYFGSHWFAVVNIGNEPMELEYKTFILTYERAQLVHLPQKLCRNSGYILRAREGLGAIRLSSYSVCGAHVTLYRDIILYRFVLNCAASPMRSVICNRD